MMSYTHQWIQLGIRFFGVVYFFLLLKLFVFPDKKECCHYEISVKVCACETNSSPHFI
jgi:hypothetical protein